MLSSHARVFQSKRFHVSETVREEPEMGRSVQSKRPADMATIRRGKHISSRDT